MSQYTIGDLKAILCMRQEINDYMERIAKLDSVLKSVTARPTEGPRGTATTDKMANGVALLLEMQEELIYKALGCEERIQEMEDEVNKLPPNFKSVIRCRYFDGLQWEEIADRTHYSISRCFEIHRLALRRLETP